MWSLPSYPSELMQQMWGAPPEPPQIGLARSTSISSRQSAKLLSLSKLLSFVLKLCNIHSPIHPPPQRPAPSGSSGSPLSLSPTGVPTLAGLLSLRPHLRPDARRPLHMPQLAMQHALVPSLITSTPLLSAHVRSCTLVLDRSCMTGPPAGRLTGLDYSALCPLPTLCHSLVAAYPLSPHLWHLWRKMFFKPFPSLPFPCHYYAISMISMISINPDPSVLCLTLLTMYNRSTSGFVTTQSPSHPIRSTI